MSMIDEAWIDPRDSVEQLKAKFEGMVLYEHIYVPSSGETIVKTLRELDDMGVVMAVTLHTRRIP